MIDRASPITSSDQIVDEAKKLAAPGRRKMVAVAGASDATVLGAVASAYFDGILDATLFGGREQIKRIADSEKIDISAFEIIDSHVPEIAAYESAKMASEDKADIIMKGFVSSSSLLKAVLNKDSGLRVHETLSHAAVLDIPRYHKLLVMTDGGVVVAPDESQKKHILENAVQVCRALGIKPVRIAISGIVDNVYESLPHSIEARQMAEELSSDINDEIMVQGPLTFDSATSSEAASRKGVTGSVAGNADIYLVNSIEECNIVGKSLINFAGAVFAGVIMGAKVPISLVSRTDTLKNKKTAVSLACLVSDYYDRTEYGASV